MITLTYFSIGDNVQLRSSLIHPEEIILGTLVKIGRKYLTIRLEDGSLLPRLHPSDIRRPQRITV